MDVKKSIGLAVASMVLGIISLLLGCCFWYITIPASLVAIVLASVSIAKKKGGFGMALTGLITSILSLVPALVIAVTGSSLLTAGSLLSKNEEPKPNVTTSITATAKVEKTEKPTETTTTAEEPASEGTQSSEDDTAISEIKKAVENGDFSLVTPDFKESMDAYEAFVNSYVEFMKNYNDAMKKEDLDVNDLAGMLKDSGEMIEKEAEWSEKIDAIDVDSLSPADGAYYTIVTLRTSEKLLEVTAEIVATLD